MQPSTHWKEQIAADEGWSDSRVTVNNSRRFRRKSAKYGNGRALHRKPLRTGHTEVLPVCRNSPATACLHRPVHEVWVRLSNGGMDRARDAVPDIRGFTPAFSVWNGDSALGNGPAKSQDFTLINQEKFSVCTGATNLSILLLLPPMEMARS